jgi:hypothetical protein
MMTSVTMPTVSAEQLRIEQAKTLSGSEPRYGLLAKFLFVTMDLDE